MPRKLVLLLLAACPAFAQARCEATFPDLKPRGATMFSPTQEGYLGDLLTEQTSRRYPVYRQPGLTDPLDQIAARLLQHLPRNEYKFKFQLIELSQTNAFAMIGGKVFVSRRLIAFVRNEDELAGVLAHEMGHVLARQSSVDLTKSFNDLLKVSSAGDQADVAQKFHQWMDIRARKPASAAHVDDDQLVADQVSMEAVWRAGYDPQGLPQFLDRLTDNKGATGNFITDLFGATRPESKRFREMLKSVEAIPASCREKRAESEQEAFRAWKKKVTELSAEDWITTSTNRAPTLRLAPKLRPDINNIKFSPDGRLLIAQDESGINILRHEPLSVVFRIPALGAKCGDFR